MASCMMPPKPGAPEERATLEDIASKMASTTGITLVDQKHFFSTTKNCFTGASAVEWLTHSGGFGTVDDAVLFGQDLIKAGVIKSTEKSDKFENTEKAYYQFQGDYATLRDKTIADFTAVDIDGQTRSLSEFKGQVCLVVNVSSNCGLTPTNYPELQKMYEKYQSEGFTVLGFPCNQFASQEPGTNEEIKAFATGKYNTTFPLFAKINVNGSDAHPLYQWLKAEQPGVLVNAIKWNFSKFLIDRKGLPVARFGPQELPFSFESKIKEQIEKK